MVAAVNGGLFVGFDFDGQAADVFFLPAVSAARAVSGNVSVSAVAGKLDAEFGNPVMQRGHIPILWRSSLRFSSRCSV